MTGSIEDICLSLGVINYSIVKKICNISFQIGSVTFFWTLSRCQVSVAVPVTNSLKFVTTFVAGQFLGEKKLNMKSFVGLVLIVAGVCLQVYSKEQD
jgi:uncharacterized membrane protein